MSRKSRSDSVLTVVEVPSSGPPAPVVPRKSSRQLLAESSPQVKSVVDHPKKPEEPLTKLPPAARPKKPSLDDHQGVGLSSWHDCIRETRKSTGLSGPELFKEASKIYKKA